MRFNRIRRGSVLFAAFRGKRFRRGIRILKLIISISIISFGIMSFIFIIFRNKSKKLDLKSSFNKRLKQKMSHGFQTVLQKVEIFDKRYKNLKGSSRINHNLSNLLSLINDFIMRYIYLLVIKFKLNR